MILRNFRSTREKKKRNQTHFAGKLNNTFWFLILERIKRTFPNHIIMAGVYTAPYIKTPDRSVYNLP